MTRYAFEMGMTIDQFNSISPRDFRLASEAHHTRTSKQFEHTRAISYMIAAANRDPKRSFPTIEKWWPLPTDGETMKRLDSERAKRIMELYEQAKKQVNVA